MPHTLARHDRPIPDPILDRDGFLTARHDYYNASATACLFDAHPYQTIADVWNNKTRNVEQDETSAMRRGTYLEDGLARWYEHEANTYTTRPGRIYIAGHLAATPDRLDPEGNPVEVKSTRLDADTVAAYWWYQVQTQMLCLNRPTSTVVWMDASQELRWEQIDADPDTQTMIVERSADFMAAVATGLAPDWITFTARDIAIQHPQPTGSIVADPDIINTLLDYEAVKQEIKDLETERERLTDVIANIMGDREQILDQNGQPLFTWKATNPKTPRFDSRAFTDDHPDLAARYSTIPAGTRQMRRTKHLADLLQHDETP